MLKSITITLLLLLTVICCSAHSSPIDTCIGEPFHKILQSVNGNRIAINDMTEDAQGNIYLAGRIEMSPDNYDAFFLKTDNAGNLLWQRSFDLSTNDECWKIRIASNGELLISGYFLYDLLLIRADVEGNIIFSKSYSGRQSILSDMLIDDEDNIVLAGLMYDANNQQQSFLTKIKSDGTLIYTALYDAPGNESFISLSASNQFYYIAALSRAATNNGVVLKVNRSDGNIIFANQYDINGRIDLINRIHVSQNGIVINGATRDVNPPARFNQFNAMMDENGNISSMQTYGNTIAQFGSDLVPASTGFIQAQTINNGEPFLSVLIMDANRNILSGKKFDVQQPLPIPLAKTSGNGYLLTHIQKLTANGIHLIRTDEAGSVPGCPDVPASEQSNPISISSSPFTYQLSNVDLQTQNLLLQTSNDGFSMQVFCGNQCRLIDISGPAEFCLSATQLTFTASRDPLCMEPVQWSYDSTMATLVSSSPTSLQLQINKPGIFRVEGSIGKGCSAISDLHEVKVGSRIPPVSLGRDTVLCNGDAYTLSIPGYESYSWSNGNTDSVQTFSRSGTYDVTVKDGCNNESRDTVTIIIPAKPLIAPTLGKDTSFCTGDTLNLFAGNGYADYLWNDGSNNRYLLATAPGTYWVQVKNAEGCIASDSINIALADCAKFIVFPNAFSPNNDGKNDLFKPSLNGALSYYQLAIFNRWGQKLYESNKPDQGWDGQSVISKDKTSTFVYFCRYQLPGQPVRVMKGTVTLIR